MSTNLNMTENVNTINLSLPQNNIRSRNPFNLALQDLYGGLKEWRIWLMLAKQDIKLRYRRSVLGPLWITLSMAITVYTMGILYAKLFHMDLVHYYPYIVSSMLAWGFISTVIIELTDSFMESEAWIKQIKLPYSLYIHKVIARNFMIFLHNFLVLIPIFIFCHEVAKIRFETLLLIPGILIVYYNGMMFGLLLAILGSRFRDISQIIRSLIQVVFFVTPIMWMPSILPKADQYIIYLNPFYSFLEIIRAPLLGHMPSLLNYLVTIGIGVLGTFMCLFIFKKYRQRIIYWL